LNDVYSYSDEKLDDLVQKSPYYLATANDVDWVAKVKMQGQIQKWVDHSISVTVNLPEDVTEEIVSKVYETGWESGCKGITVYREGSRSGVLISKDNKNKNTQPDTLSFEVKKRPRILEADVVRFQNNNERWIAFVGVLDGKPYEIFTGIEDEEVWVMPKSIKKGYIIKNKEESGETRYDFQYVDKHGYRTTIEGLSRMFDKEFWNYAKLISGVLRYGMPITDVINLVGSLQLDSDNINTWKAGVERALKKYIPDGAKPKKGAVCPNCGQDALVYKEGCLTCSHCGYSKCG
jgi:ribonucleoside-diphosphate reductase alpha chain